MLPPGIIVGCGGGDGRRGGRSVVRVASRAAISGVGGWPDVTASRISGGRTISLGVLIGAPFLSA
jgi:hypothetical protein